MHSSPSLFIADLVADLRPVRRLTLGRGIALICATALITAALAHILFGIRADVLAAEPNPVFLLTFGLVVMLGCSAAVSVIMMGRPQVGNRHDGWKWALAMAMLVPLTALVMAFANPPRALDHAHPAFGYHCLFYGLALSFVSAAGLVWWLRRGAPTSPERAGFLTGLASGCFGMAGYALHCGIDSIVHIGVWHSLTVIIACVAGRFLVPRLIRW